MKYKKYKYFCKKIDLIWFYDIGNFSITEKLTIHNAIVRYRIKIAHKVTLHFYRFTLYYMKTHVSESIV